MHESPHQNAGNGIKETLFFKSLIFLGSMPPDPPKGSRATGKFRTPMHADTQLQLESENEMVKKVKNTKVLGVQLDENLNWEKHIDYISSKISSGIGAIKRLREFVDQSTLVKVYNALIQPYFDYCSEVWDCFNKGLSDRLQKLQNRAARMIMGLKNEHRQSAIALKSLGWMTLEERRAQLKAKLMFKGIWQYIFILAYRQEPLK